MAKHDQQWRDTRWQRQEKQKAVEKKRRAWEKKERERCWEEALAELKKTTDWLEGLNGDFSFLKEIGPGVDFSKILEGTPGKFLYQKWNGDGTYEIAYETDLYTDACQNRKIGTVKVTIYRVSYIAGRSEIHGRY